MPKISDDKKAERRQHIVSAALDCFAVKGVDGTSMRDICAAAGVSRGGLYVYFETKDELIEAVFAFLSEQGQSLFDGLPPDDGGAGPLLEIMQRAFGMFRGPGVMKILAIDAELKSYVLRNPALLAARRAEGMQVIERLRDLVVQAQARGVVDDTLDPVLFAAMLLAIQDGTKQSVTMDHKLDVDAYLETILQALKIKR
jgi:AcrR family transcriptional regulator